MWTITLLDDPLNDDNDVVSYRRTNNIAIALNDYDNNAVETATQLQQTRIALCTCSMAHLLGTGNKDIIIGQEKIFLHAARIALTDYVARIIAVHTIAADASATTLQHLSSSSTNRKNIAIRIEPLDRTTSSNRQSLLRHYYIHNNNGVRNGSKQQHTTKMRNNSLPYILERSDVTTMNLNEDSNNSNNNDYQLQIYVRVFVYSNNDNAISVEEDDEEMIKQTLANCMTQYLDFTTSNESMKQVMTHIAITILQEKLRSNIMIDNRGVAFIANGAILPRKSGASTMPMSCPPAIPFTAPTNNSAMHQSVQIDMGLLTQFLLDHLPQDSKIINDHTISLSGLLIPPGVSLIVGGGYHGKSTLLRCIAAGVYNKILGDGREFCVTVRDAVSVRAEDGRYVNNCNVSAFISNLPIATIDTRHFSTTEASGSTSQASNVIEAIEMGATAMLVDEDVSAANFMARDGRMRSLVMDESITPLLYRVNGLFRTHGISSIVVVGGVGDWLDVPDHVILMDRYACHDATVKARSISKQFSHGHVQYAGRGVVHRLNWEKSGTPLPRRPTFSTKSTYNILTTAVTLLDGSNSIALQNIVQSNHEQTTDTKSTAAICIDDDAEDNEDEDEDERYIDMSRCEQLLGKKPELYGCGLCVAWILNYSQQHPEFGIRELLQKMDDAFDQFGWTGIVQGDNTNSPGWIAAVGSLGFVYRPRRFEVGQALTRFRGVTFADIPIEDDGSDEAARIEAERQRNELLEIWNNRRKKN